MSEAFNCTTCSKVFKSKKTLAKHLKSKRHLKKAAADATSEPEVEVETKQVVEEKEPESVVIPIEPEIVLEDIVLPPVDHILVEKDGPPIKYLYHISDIHVPCDKRHQEFREVFARFINEIKENDKKGIVSCENAAVVITGDFVDNKNRITPEEIILARAFILDLAHHCPVFIIAGNHDKNLNFAQKEDNITAIVANGQYPHPNLHYLKFTGVYKFRNINFSVSSVFDYRMIKATEAEDNQYKIALFHGGVGKYVLYNGTYGTNGIPLNTFNGYDYVLLGDIHKWQYCDKEKRIAYAGSMLQKNHGEHWSDHGYLLWNLESKEITHTPLQNNYRFVTIGITDGQLMTPVDSFPPNLYVRWEVKETGTECPPPNAIQESIRSRFNVEAERYTHSAFFPEEPYSAGPRTVFDLGLEKQHEYIVSWLGSENKHMDSADLESLKEFTSKYNGIAQETIPPATHWRLLDLEFKNIFCYQTQQRLNFDGMKGVNGIVAQNNAGKSAIFDILLFTLFGKCTRSDLYSYIDLVHVGSEEKEEKCELHCMLRFQTVERNETYQIDRKCTRERQSMVVIIKKNGMDIYNGSARDANALISKLIGNYEDFLTTTVLAQNSIYNFLTLPGRNQKEFTARIFRLDLYEKLHKLAKKDMKLAEAEMKIRKEEYEGLLKEDCPKQLESVRADKERVTMEKENIGVRMKAAQAERQVLWESMKPVQHEEPAESLDFYQKKKASLFENLEQIASDNEEKTNSYNQTYDTVITDENISTIKKEVEENIRQCALKENPQLLDRLASLWAELEQYKKDLKSLKGKKIKKGSDKPVKKTASLERIKKRFDIISSKLSETQEFLKNTLSEGQKPEFQNANLETLQTLRSEKEVLLHSLPAEPSDPFADMRKKVSLKNLDILAYAKERKEDALKEIESQQQQILLWTQLRQIHQETPELPQKVKEIYTVWETYKTKFNEKPEEEREAITQQASQPMWLQKQFQETQMSLKEVEMELKSLRKEEEKAVLTEKKLEGHRYDPNCKFCCENPFVKAAQVMIDKLPALRAKIEQKEESYKIIHAEVKAQTYHREVQSKLDNARSRHDEAESSLAAIEKAFVRHDEAVKVQETRKQIQEQLTEMTTKINDVETHYQKKQKLTLKEQKAGALVHNLERLSSDFSHGVEKLEALEKENEEAKTRLPELEKQLKAIQEVILLRESRVSKRKELKETEDNIRIKAQNDSAREANKMIKARIQELEGNLKKDRNQDMASAQELIHISLSESKWEQKIEQQKDTETKYAKIRREAELLRVYVAMSHHNGIPAFLLRKITKLLEDTSNQILGQYSEMRVKIRNEGKETTIRVKNPQKSSYLNAKMLCGSEKFLVELAFRVAFQLLSNVSKPNFMVCDEGWSCLDENARSRLRFLLAALLEHNDYLLTVSHIQDVKAWMTQAISINIQEDGSHRIVQG